MANHSRGKGQSQTVSAQPAAAPLSVFSEPEVRRWSHPVNPSAPGGPTERQPGAAQHYIHCALAYQNQLLADIKSLLEQLVSDAALHTDEK